MPKLRSPNCPQMTFADAVQKAKKIYDTEHTHPADKKVIADDLGYTSLSGRSLSLIGALRQYGILEGSGEALRVSDDAVAFYELPENSPERAEAVRRMIFKPSLFEELRQQFGENLPGEANLRHTLIKRNFLPKAADEVIRVYRENWGLVAVLGSEYNSSDELATQTQEPEKFSGRKSANAGTDQEAAQARSYAFDISIPRQVKGELRIVGRFGKDDLERLKKALDGQLAMMAAALED